MREDNNATGDLDIKSSLTLAGAGENTTTVDGGQLDRVLHVIGSVSVKISGVKITGGQTGLSQYGGSEDGGGLYIQGSLSGTSPVVTLTHTIVVSNSTGSGYAGGGPGEGGGIYNLFGALALVDSQVISNTAGNGAAAIGEAAAGASTAGSVPLRSSIATSAATPPGMGRPAQDGGDGGGIYHYGRFAATLVESVVSHNTGGKGGSNPGGSGGYGGDGGGLYIDGPLTITNSTIISNTTGYGGGGSTIGLYGQGGGLYNKKLLHIAGSTLSGNLSVGHGGGIYNSGALTVSLSAISTNTAAFDGGGLYLSTASAVFDRTTIQGNRAVTGNAMHGGGGLYVSRSAITLTNDLIADNRICSGNCAFVYGPGIYLEYSTAHVLHTTLARNQGGDGAGLHATYAPTYPDGRYYSTVFMTNTIVVSHTVGVRSEKSKVWQESTLWGSGSWANVANWGGSSSITHTNDYTGTPNFVNPDAGDYHVAAGSAAIDQGINAGVTIDIDNQPRPNPNTDIPDLGADEFWTCTGIDEVAISGPVTGTAYTPLAFSAVVTPSAATPYLDYSWFPEPVVGQGTDAVTYTFAAGDNPVKLTVRNCGGSRETTRIIPIQALVPGVPVLLAPPNGTVTTTAEISFVWQAGPSPLPTGYNLQLDGKIITTTGTVSATVLAEGLHAWTVRAYNSSGYSDWAALMTVEVKRYHIYLPLALRN